MRRLIWFVAVLLWVTLVPAVGPAAGESGVSAGNGLIAFVEDGDIYTTSPDRTGLRRLTDDPAPDYQPRWSPDGTRLAFTSERDGDAEIYVMDADGGNQQRLTVNPSADRSPVWSPDGTQIVFERSHGFISGFCDPGPDGEPVDEPPCRAYELFLMDASGTGTTQLTENAFGMDIDADWSPDGTQIVFNSIGNTQTQAWWIEVYDLVTDSTAVLFGDSHSEETGPKWSPDGSLIGLTKQELWSNVWVVRPDDTGRRNVSQGEVQEFFGDWRPDGMALAFTTWLGANREVFAVDVAGTTRTNLTSNAANDRFVSWSPDGRLIAFSRDGGLWLADATDGSNQRSLGVPADDVSWQPLPLAMEAGKATVKHRWTQVSLTESFTDPVVVAGPASLNGPQPTTIRIRNVTPTGFELRLDEWDYLDGTHAYEEVDYLVVERGHHVLPGGAHLEAGSIVTNATKRLDAVEFAIPFRSYPAVFTTVVTHNGADAVVTRVSDVSATGFSVKLQEQEANKPWHVPETVDYVAWDLEAGWAEGDPFRWNANGWTEVNHEDNRTVIFDIEFLEAPCVLADLNTLNGTDPANLRFGGKYWGGIRLQVDEEQSADPEVWHVIERAAWLAIDCS